MHYINVMESVFDKMHDYISIWRAIMVTEFSPDFCEVANDDRRWQIRCAPEFLIIDLDNGAELRCHGFTLNTYKDKLGSARELSFSRFYYLWNFVKKMTLRSENGIFLYCVATHLATSDCSRGSAYALLHTTISIIRPIFGNIVVFDMSLSSSGRAHQTTYTYMVVFETTNNLASCPVR